ncbi:MAG: ankyrin repeat domain-containing protein [Spirochaetota bacterium]|nr:ankyrin repeat domain-containing protein [Spirochaetota bacterium]
MKHYLLPILWLTVNLSFCASLDRDLHLAIVEGNLAKVKSVIAKGYNINAKDPDGWPLLHRAIRAGKMDITKYLVDKGAQLNNRTLKAGFTPLDIAVASGKIELVDYLLDRGASLNAVDNSGDSLLLTSLGYKKIEMAKFLIKKGIDIHIKNKSGWTALHSAASRGRLDIIKMLINKGSGINAKTTDAGTALSYAAGAGHVEIVNYLIDKGAKLNAVDINGNTALHLATQWGKTEVVRLLLSKGARINLTNKEGFSELFIAVEKGYLEIVQLLLNRPAKVNMTYSLNIYRYNNYWPLLLSKPQRIIEVLASPKNDNSPKISGWTVLHEAASHGRLDIARLLISHGANVRATTEYGDTVLFIAALHSSDNVELVKYLIAKGASPMAKITQGHLAGWTALHGAAYRGNVQIVNYLINIGMDINSKSRTGHTPLDLAKNDKLRAVLIKHGATRAIPIEQ